MSTDCRYSILLGSIGGDSHSVGLAILREALLANQYRVHFLGTQNPLEAIFEIAGLFDLVMISNADGHAERYLRPFPELMRKHAAHRPLWYLGGNLTIGEPLGYDQYFRGLGFHRVFTKFVDVRQVLATIAADFAGREPIGFTTGPLEQRRPHLLGVAAVSDDRLDPETFRSERREVLQLWKTGRAAQSLKANAEFLARQPSLAGLQRARSERRAPLLIQPRCGVALAGDQLRLFQGLEGGGASVLSYQVDSLTRNNNYAAAEEAIRESGAFGSSTINGFPVVNHGVAPLRRIASSLCTPLQVRHSTRDPRLLAEIAYAGGVTGFEGGAICYNIPYYRDYPLDEAIRKWQYVDYLTGLYYDRFGIVLDREFFGTLTATLIPPCLAIAVGLLQSLLAANQGVRSVSPGYAEGGNRAQDIAAIRVLEQMTSEWLRNSGHNVQVNTVFHQYMAAFPSEYERAEQLIISSAVTAQLSGATRVIIKTPVEALRIPMLRENLHALDLVRVGIDTAQQLVVDETAVAREAALIRREVDCILDAVLSGGAGSVAKGIVAAFAQGHLDIPFSPSIHNRGQVLTARDADGAVRFLSIGNLPFDKTLREFHRDRMDSRIRTAGLAGSSQKFLLVEHDVLQIPRGEFARWPLG